MALINAVQRYFENKRIVGCLFHYIQSLRRYLESVGFFKENMEDLGLFILKEFTLIPWTLSNNKNAISDIFTDLLNKK